LEVFTNSIICNIIIFVVDSCLIMKDIHQVIRFNYTRISDNIQSELKFLSELAELTDDERFKQSVAEVIYSLNDLSETLNLQRRYLKSRFDAE
jgi:type IV secretory pathway VirD2 relaxase